MEKLYRVTNATQQANVPNAKEQERMKVTTKLSGQIHYARDLLYGINTCSLLRGTYAPEIKDELQDKVSALIESYVEEKRKQLKECPYNG